MIYNLSQINLASLVAAAATAAVRRRRPAALRVGSAQGADRRRPARLPSRAAPDTHTLCSGGGGGGSGGAARQQQQQQQQHTKWTRVRAHCAAGGSCN